MKKDKIILLLFTLLTALGCTKDIDISVDVEPFLVLDGYLTPDSIVKIRLSKSRFAYKYQSEKDLIIKDAEVKLYVNDKFIQKMQSVDKDGSYLSNYKPKANESIKITAQKEGFETIEATTTIPQAPVFLLKDTTERYYEGEDTWREGLGNVDNDTLNRELTKTTKAHFLLTDLPNDSFYFYKVFTISYTLLRNKQTSLMDTVWESREQSNSYNLKKVIPIVHSEDNIEDVFDFENADKDRIFDGVTLFTDKMLDESKINIYFTFDSRIGRSRYVEGKFVGNRYEQEKEDKREVRLSSMSKDLYLFIKSLDKAEEIEGSPFAEPVQIYSNVKNGAGILGSYNTTKYIIKTKNR